MSYQYSSRPLEWKEFKKLMREMNRSIADKHNIYRKKYAQIQTLMAIGAYLGPLAMELLSIKWNQVRGVGAYFFVNESYRQPLVIDKELKSIIDKNYNIVNPLSDQAYIISENAAGLSGKPLAPIKFNNMLDNVFKQFGIDIPSPSSITLRRTFARKVWQDDGGSEGITQELAMELRLYAGSVKRYIQT
ncbi:MAG: hypothetical protein AAGF85_20905 [Bacteroidota bacterium]